MADVLAESGSSRPSATADTTTPKKSVVDKEETLAEIEIIEGIKAGDAEDQDAQPENANNANKDIEAEGDIKLEEKERRQEYYFSRSHWIPRYERLLRKLLDSDDVSYARLLALYTEAMLPISENLENDGGRRLPLSGKTKYHQRKDFQQSVSLDFIPLRRVRILDLQLRLREDTDYVCFGKFGNHFNPSHLERIQQTLNEYDAAMEAYQKIGTTIGADPSWSKELVEDHAQLLRIFEIKQSRSAKIEQTLDRALSLYPSFSFIGSVYFGVIGYLIHVVKMLLGNEQRRTGALLPFLWKEFQALCFRTTVGVMGALPSLYLCL
ncbi:hypothetical protein B0J14DRAFT_71283 [Halenospora varia]|nr:hypothetical protein B0J14DRAFT_71283 [Halenospora varia]